MDNPHQPPRSAKVVLHPAMQPTAMPGDIDIHKMSDDDFRMWMGRISDYREIYQPVDRKYYLRGMYSAQGENRNAVYVRMGIEGPDGEELAYMDFNAAACVQVAGDLLEFAVGLANLNGVPEVISEQLMDVIGRFLHPDTFSQLKGALMIAAEEELKAKLRVHDLAKNKKA